MDFEPSEDLVAWRQAVKTFADREIAPLVDAAEAAERTPRSLFAKAGAAGLLGAHYPVELGGSGTGCLAETIMREEFAYVCSGIAAALSVSSHLGTYPVYAFGSDDQKNRYLVPALRGEKVSAFGLTEPDAGSDVRALRTRAERTGDGWRLRGRKTFITNAPIADFILVVAYTDRDAGLDGMALFIVDLPNDAVTITPIAKMGNLSSEIAEVALDDVVVAEDACLGGERGAFKRVMQTIGVGRVVVAGGAIGVARAALDAAVSYARDRQAFGEPIGSYQGVSFPLARAWANVEAARLAVYRAATLIDRGDEAPEATSTAKLLAGEAVLQAVDRAIRVFGGYGYMREYPIERYYRDARYFAIVEGTQEIHLRVIASRLGL